MGLMASGVLWIGLYIHLVMLPLAVGAPMGPGAACGYMALTIMILELSLISKIRPVASVFGQDALLRFHRRMGIAAAGLALVHAAIMMTAGYPLEWLNPFTEGNPWAMRFGVIGGMAVLALIGLSLGRKTLHISYNWWQRTHGTLADAAIAVSFAHILLFDGYSSSGPMRILLICYGGAAVCLRVWFRVIRPLRIWSRPWEVVANIAEHGATHTLVLRPAGHEGFVFEPGQFAWLSTAKTPFHADNHPISMSSAAPDRHGGTVAFSIKKLGDWSGETVPALPVGHKVWVDGPHGVFTADRAQGPGYVLIGGGSGIAPLFSMCETFAARGDRRPVVLFFAGRDEESLTFRERLAALEKEANLRVVYVLEHPPPDWRGERGLVTAEILGRHLPPQYKRFQFFVCGPEPMMDAVEDALAALGVPARQIHTERFVMV
jgi:predicted ferric reductase